MKKSYFLFLTFVCVIFLNACNIKEHKSKDSDSLSFEASYLGQKLPGLKAEVFAPGIVTTEHMEFFGSFTPDLKEFYFKRKGGKYKKSTLVVIQYKNYRWSESVVSPAEASVGEPSISPDGNTIYLDSRYIERINSGWSKVKSLGAPFKDIPIMRLTVSATGTYVFDEREEIGTIRYSRLIDGKREAPKAFGKEINTGKWIAHPFIAPDESYLIWDSEREGGYGDSDLYISFRQEDGSWGPAINMGEEIIPNARTYMVVSPQTENTYSSIHI
ncbi:PD40 domain-containing protein [Flagellimonas sp. HMM57]|uniref:PD40 domain-containing protein n=1 Tax=unclassified Flagellimonas TaxID=2644544 RepID=UPI0013D0AECA|nr:MULTISPECIES: PD40 domain-containing protein [unclassified Flagellimonas]UII77836.1 PD40 domain-containing protein [Flagellimonas sp. HMM57]